VQSQHPDIYKHYNGSLDRMRIDVIRYEPHTSSLTFQIIFPAASLLFDSCEVVSSGDIRKNEA